MSLKEFVNGQSLVKCSLDTPLQECAKMMKEHDVGSVVVCEGDKAVGILTDRDIVLRCVSEGKDLSQCTAQDCMSKPLAQVPGEAGIHDAISLMEEKQVRRIVITDANDTPIGVISHGDVIKLFAREINELATGTAPREEKLIGEPKTEAKAAS